MGSLNSVTCGEELSYKSHVVIPIPEELYIMSYTPTKHSFTTPSLWKDDITTTSLLRKSAIILYMTSGPYLISPNKINW